MKAPQHRRIADESPTVIFEVAQFILNDDTAPKYKKTLEKFPDLFLHSITGETVKNRRIYKRCCAILKKHAELLDPDWCQRRYPSYGPEIDRNLAEIVKQRLISQRPINAAILRQILIVLLHKRGKASLLESKCGMDNKFRGSWAQRFCTRNKLPSTCSSTMNTGQVIITRVIKTVADTEQITCLDVDLCLHEVQTTATELSKQAIFNRRAFSSSKQFQTPLNDKSRPVGRPPKVAFDKAVELSTQMITERKADLSCTLRRDIIENIRPGGKGPWLWLVYEKNNPKLPSLYDELVLPLVLPDEEVTESCPVLQELWTLSTSKEYSLPFPVKQSCRDRMAADREEAKADRLKQQRKEWVWTQMPLLPPLPTAVVSLSVGWTNDLESELISLGYERCPINNDHDEEAWLLPVVSRRTDCFQNRRELLEFLVDSSQIVQEYRILYGSLSYQTQEDEATFDALNDEMEVEISGSSQIVETLVARPTTRLPPDTPLSPSSAQVMRQNREIILRSAAEVQELIAQLLFPSSDADAGADCGAAGATTDADGGARTTDACASASVAATAFTSDGDTEEATTAPPAEEVEMAGSSHIAETLEARPTARLPSDTTLSPPSPAPFISPWRMRQHSDRVRRIAAKAQPLITQLLFPSSDADAGADCGAAGADADGGARTTDACASASVAATAFTSDGDTEEATTAPPAEEVEMAGSSHIAETLEARPTARLPPDTTLSPPSPAPFTSPWRMRQHSDRGRIAAKAQPLITQLLFPSSDANAGADCGAGAAATDYYYRDLSNHKTCSPLRTKPRRCAVNSESSCTPLFFGGKLFDDYSSHINYHQQEEVLETTPPAVEEPAVIIKHVRRTSAGTVMGYESLEGLFKYLVTNKKWDISYRFGPHGVSEFEKRHSAYQYTVLSPLRFRRGELTTSNLLRKAYESLFEWTNKSNNSLIRVPQIDGFMHGVVAGYTAMKKGNRCTNDMTERLSYTDIRQQLADFFREEICVRENILFAYLFRKEVMDAVHQIGLSPELNARLVDSYGTCRGEKNPDLIQGCKLVIEHAIRYMTTTTDCVVLRGCYAYAIMRKFKTEVIIKDSKTWKTVLNSAAGRFYDRAVLNQKCSHVLVLIWDNNSSGALWYPAVDNDVAFLSRMNPPDTSYLGGSIS